MANVRGYTLSTCPYCKRTKKFFADHHIPFAWIDYDLANKEDQVKIAQEIKAYSGGGISFPYVVIGDTVVMGHNPDRYRALLGFDD